MSEKLERLGTRVKKLRVEKGLTMDEFAKRCGYRNRSTTYMIEAGKQSISLDQLKTIANVLGVDPYYLYNGDSESKTVEVSSSEFELLTEFRNLSEQEQQFLINFIKKK